jgi:glycosyltransferase involved in cell wall biosynthesis
MMKKSPRVLLLLDCIPADDALLQASLRKNGLDCSAMGIHFDQSKWTPMNKIFSHWPQCLWVSIKAFSRRHEYEYMLAWSQTIGTLLGLIKFITRSNSPKVFILEAIIVERNNPILEKFRRWIIAISWKKINHIGLMSNAYKSLIQARFSIPECQCVHLKVPLINIDNNPNFSGFKAGSYLYSVGRSYRDYQTLMAAAQKSACQFVVLTSDDALKGLTIPDNVKVLRNVFGQESDKLLREAAAVIIPLDRTTSPAGELTLTEAMHHGKPVIITQTLISQEYIVHGQSGFLVPAKDPDAIVEAVNIIFSDPEKATLIGRMARQTVMENHSLDAFSRNISDIIYKDIYGEKLS